jgi:hypothetical protein
VTNRFSLGPSSHFVLAVLLAAACGLDTQPTNLASPSHGSGAASGGPSKSDEEPTKRPAVPDDDAEDEDDDDDRGRSNDRGDDEVEDDERASDDCSVDCDDGDPCTRDARMGDDEDCSCSHVAITRMRDGDRCCPDGASALDDADCGAVAECGNGELDPGEECDGEPECSQACTQLFPDSLVHRYSFDGEGMAVVDSVGDSDGVVVNGNLAGDGDLVLEGGDYVELPAGMLSALTSATIEVWVTLVRGAGGARIFDFGNRTASGDGTSYWALTPSSIADGNAMTLLNLTPGVDVGTGDQYLSGRSPVPSGAMHHVAVVFDAEARNLSLYVDGTVQGNRANITGSLAELDDSNAWLGRAQFGAYPFLDGRIHEFRIYDQALTAAAITASFEAGPDPGR